MEDPVRMGNGDRLQLPGAHGRAGLETAKVGVRGDSVARYASPHMLAIVLSAALTVRACVTGACGCCAPQAVHPITAAAARSVVQACHCRLM